MTRDQIRHGVTTLFAALDIATAESILAKIERLCSVTYFRDTTLARLFAVVGDEFAVLGQLGYKLFNPGPMAA